MSRLIKKSGVENMQSTNQFITVIRKINEHMSFFIVVIAAIFTISFRSWSPMYFLGGLLLVSTIVPACLSKALSNASKKIDDPFQPAYIAVVALTAATLLIGVYGVVERVIWFNAESVPSIFINKTYKKYTNNNHRVFKVECSEYKRPMMVIVRGDTTYARCGEFAPAIYTIAVPTADYERAQKETAKDDPNAPIFLEPDAN
jgi:hypothetical protein